MLGTMIYSPRPWRPILVFSVEYNLTLIFSTERINLEAPPTSTSLHLLEALDVRVNLFCLIINHFSLWKSSVIYIACVHFTINIVSDISCN